MKKLVLATISVLFATGCASSNYSQSDRVASTTTRIVNPNGTTNAYIRDGRILNTDGSTRAYIRGNSVYSTTGSRVATVRSK